MVLFESGNLATFKDLFFNVSIPVSEGLASAAQLIQLIGGALMILGLFNSLSSFVLLATFCVLTFVSGTGRIVSENETTFLFALLSLFFLLTGAGRLSLDHLLTLNRSEDRAETGLAASRKFGRYVSKS